MSPRPHQGRLRADPPARDGRWASFWLAAALLLVAMNLRAPIAAVGPVLDDVRIGLGMSGAAAGLLTTLPVLCFGLAAVFAPGLARRLGAETALLASLLVLLVGTAMRLMPEIGAFFLGTLVLGGGIAVANVLLPVIIKRHFPRPATMMGLYTMVLTGAPAVIAALTVPLEHALDSWPQAIAAWGLLAALAVVAWLPAVRRSRTGEREAAPPRVRLWRDRVAWAVTALFAVQSMLFYCTLAWVPDILRAAGADDAEAGVMLSLMLVLGIPGAYVASALAGRVRDQRVVVASFAALAACGLTGLLVAAGVATPLWMVLLGFGQGGVFSIALTLVVLRAPDGPHATALSGMAQGTGYLLAAPAPVLIGVLHDMSGGWTVPTAALLGFTAANVLFGLAAARPGMVGGVPEADGAVGILRS